MNDTTKIPPAYPNAHPDRLHSGMSLRDRIALEVLPAIYNEFFWSIREGDHGFDENWREGLALDAYAQADAMLKARSSHKEE